MRYAVTAVSGQLGQEIARKLIERTDHASVIGLARTPGNATELGIEVRPGDYDQPDALRTVNGLRKDWIVHGCFSP